MRFLHTGDWHLGKKIGGHSRIGEQAAVLQQVVDVALRERVDAVLIAGDTFDSFSPPDDAERLLYDTLLSLLRERIAVVMIAGNHDHAPRMDALSGVLRLAGMHCVGGVPMKAPDAALTIASRDGNEQATIVALPWVPERLTGMFESMAQGLEVALTGYADRMETAIRRVCEAFRADTVNIFLAHMLIDGAVIGEGGGERPLHMGHNFAVRAASLPDDAQYVALGHVHRPQELALGHPAFYAGSLLQLDFGESEQRKSVNIIDADAGRAAKVERITIDAGRPLRTLRVPSAELESHAGKHDNAWLHVIVQLDAADVGLYDRVRRLFPTAVKFGAELPDAPDAQAPVEDRRGLSPQDLFARFYRGAKSADAPEELLRAFGELLQECERAPA